MYIIDDFGQLPVASQAEFLDDLRLIENGIFSYRICMDFNDYTIDDIINIIQGYYVCQRKSTRQKIINIVKQNILENIYDDYKDKWLIQDKVNAIYKHLSEKDLYDIIIRNQKSIQMIIATEDVSFQAKKFYCDRTIAINNICMDNDKLISIPANVRWYNLYRRSDIQTLLSSEDHIYFFFGNDINELSRYVKYERNDSYDKPSAVVISNGFDIAKLKPVILKYGLNIV